MAGWVGKVAALDRSARRAMVDHVMAAAKLHADDTPVPVLAPATQDQDRPAMGLFAR
jgi:hypothetical protein